MAYRYDTRSVTVVLPAAVRYFFAMNGNRSRVALISTGNPSNSVRVANRKMPDNDPGIYVIGSGIFNIVRTSDYGPLVTDEIWISSFGGATTVTLTEIFRIR